MKTSISPSKLLLVLAALLTPSLWGNIIPNGNFTLGSKQPDAWTPPSNDTGEWVKPTPDSPTGSIKVTGNGEDSRTWLSAPVEFKPGSLYQLSFRARSHDASSGTGVSGPNFVNIDIGVPDTQWMHYRNVFAVPHSETSIKTPLRLGQWHTKGSLEFDNVEIHQVQPVYAHCGKLSLGSGELLQNSHYTFNSLLGDVGRNHARPLHRFTANFNSDRWLFGSKKEVVYHHNLKGHNWLQAEISVSFGHYVSGKLEVDISVDGINWQSMGNIDKESGGKLQLPAATFPCQELYVRLTASEKSSFQINRYFFAARTDNTQEFLQGLTRYVTIDTPNKTLDLKVLEISSLLPGNKNSIRLATHNSDRPINAEAVIELKNEKGKQHTSHMNLTIPTGKSEFAIPCTVPDTGEWVLSIRVKDLFQLGCFFIVPEFYNSNYGERLPITDRRAVIWRASSGWKVPRQRNIPEKTAHALEISAACNEAEMTQLVITPAGDLHNVIVAADDLKMGNNTVSADHIKILRVGYVPVTQKTDRTGVEAEWPDPLLPQDKPALLEAGMNHPYMIRIKIPKNTVPGIYTGKITIKGDNTAWHSPIEVRVYDFTLPDKSTCHSAFGLGMSRVWQYHNLENEKERRLILDKYLQLFSESHLSPYNPAPLDPWTLTWEGLPLWQGGEVTSNEKQSGVNSLYVNDDKTNANVSARYDKTLTIPAQGFALALTYKTATDQSFVVSFNHFDQQGKWLHGKNQDFRINGSATWQSYQALHDQIPAGAITAKITIYAAGYHNTGETTGAVWLNDFLLRDIATGQTIINNQDFEVMDPARLTPIFDWKQWDQAMERSFNHYHFQSFRLHIDGLGGGTFHARYEPSLLGYTGGTPAYEQLMQSYLGGIETHLREKGWLDKAYVYWFDEPDPKDYEFVMRGFDTLKRHAPGLRRMLTEQVEPELAGGPNLWCPLTPHFKETKAIEERRQAGDEFWWYICTGPKAPYATLFIDHPGTELRVWLWQAWEHQVTGVLVWESVYWHSTAAYPDKNNPQNPYLDPMGWVSGYSTSPGTKTPWGNGDGRFIYPPLAAATGRPAQPVLDDPVTSFRLEMLREGIEDYEYFVILQQLIQDKAGKLSQAERAALTTLLKVPESVSVSLTEFTKDPAPMEVHRKLLAENIEKLIRK